MRRLRQSLLLGLPLMLMAVLLPRKAHARKPANAKPARTAPAHALVVKTHRIQGLVDRIRLELAIPEPVAVSLVEVNDLVVSVARAADRANGFQMALEEHFVSGLTDAELEAVVAHELGHVWIFTHHPYLQTEAGANDVALRLVHRKTLEDVYQKVWMRVGGRGSLVYLSATDQ